MIRLGSGADSWVFVGETLGLLVIFWDSLGFELGGWVNVFNELLGSNAHLLFPAEQTEGPGELTVIGDFVAVHEGGAG